MKSLWKRFKEWLICRVLGGTTMKDTDYWYTLAMNREADLAKAERNYLALLNAYNTLAEHWRNPMHNAKALHQHCKGYNNCIGCEFGTVCKVDGLPCNWELEEDE